MLAQRTASAAGLLAALCTYVGGYYHLVDPIWLTPGNVGEPVTAHYDVGGSFAAWFFRPMEAVDRRLRPEWWAGFPATPPWQESVVVDRTGVAGEHPRHL